MYIDTIKLKKSLIYVAAILFAVLSAGTVVYYIICPSAAYFHADCSDTILWAQASYDSGAMFNPDFGYAAMLPFGGTTLMIPFIGIFGVSMTTHRIGMVIFALIMFASVLGLCKTIRLGTPLSLAATGAFALVMCSSEKMREIFYEHVIYYSISAVIIFVLLSLFVKFKENFENEKGTKGLIVITLGTVIISVCSALDGMQVLSTSVLPVLFAAVAGIFLDKDNTLFSKKSRVSLYFCLLCGVSVFVGLALLSFFSNGVSSGYASAYSSYSNMDEWIENLLKFPEQWFSLFGVDAYYGMSIFSAESVVNLIRIGAAALIAVIPVVSLFFYSKFSFAVKALVMTHFGLSGVIMVGYVFGILSLAEWRLSPMICTGLLVCFAVGTAAKEYVVPKRIFAAMICLIAVLCGINFVTVTEMRKDGILYNEKYQLSQQLKANGLTYGYATFWNSQAITVLSDSEVRAANVDVDDRGITPCAYQSNMNWFEEQEGVDEYFVLLSYDEEETLMATEDWVYFDLMAVDRIDLEGYAVYVFKSTAFLY